MREKEGMYYIMFIIYYAKEKTDKIGKIKRSV